jgi:hypothetical protein
MNASAESSSKDRVDRRRCVTMHRRDDVTIGVKCQRNRGVPEHLADELEMDAAREEHRRRA